MILNINRITVKYGWYIRYHATSKTIFLQRKDLFWNLWRIWLFNLIFIFIWNLFLIRKLLIVDEEASSTKEQFLWQWLSCISKLSPPSLILFFFSSLWWYSGGVFWIDFVHCPLAVNRESYFVYVLQIGFNNDLFISRKYPKYVPKCLSSQLRSCTIHYEGFGGEVQFETYIFQNARLLPLLKINISHFLNPKAIQRSLEELSSCPKMSPECKHSHMHQLDFGNLNNMVIPHTNLKTYGNFSYHAYFFSYILIYLCSTLFYYHNFALWIVMCFPKITILLELFQHFMSLRLLL